VGHWPHQAIPEFREGRGQGAGERCGERNKQAREEIEE